MVLQIEDARKARSGELLFIPGAIGVLLFEQMPHSLRYGGIIGIRRSQQANQAPGSLRWRARSLPLQFGVVVGSDRFAKATILILHGAKPGHSALAIVAGAEGNGFQRAQHAACAIDIIDAPASIPRAIRRLFSRQISHTPLHHRVRGRPAVPSKTFEHPRRDIG